VVALRQQHQDPTPVLDERLQAVQLVLVEGLLRPRQDQERAILQQLRTDVVLVSGRFVDKTIDR
jgi:hypothetical protein